MQKWRFFSEEKTSFNAKKSCSLLIFSSGLVGHIIIVFLVFVQIIDIVSS